MPDRPTRTRSPWTGRAMILSSPALVMCSIQQKWCSAIEMRLSGLIVVMERRRRRRFSWSSPACLSSQDHSCRKLSTAFSSTVDCADLPECSSGQLPGGHVHPDPAAVATPSSTHLGSLPTGPADPAHRLRRAGGSGPPSRRTAVIYRSSSNPHALSVAAVAGHWRGRLEGYSYPWAQQK
jgi:hypothetical protein